MEFISNNKRISVVLPFHNSEKYLDECIQSILKQTYKNIELILVDAESTDKSLEVINKYLSDNVKIYKEKYDTLCFALKKGIEQSTGDYTTIIKAEDFVKEDFIEKLYEQIEKNKSDIAMSNYYKYSEKDNLFYFHNFKEDYCIEEFNLQEVISRQETWVKNNKLLNNTMYNFLVGKLYKKNILEHIGHFTLEEKNIMSWLYNKCKSITLFNENLYIVRDCLEKQPSLVNEKKIYYEELISIIVPVYNTENYLVECLESIRNQTYKNIEIILINDGSTDNSEKICRKFAENDKRFKLFNKINGGLSSARNVGIEKSKSNLIFFIDSDDFIEKDCIEKLYRQQYIHDADIIISNHYIYDEKEDLFKYYFLNGDFKIEEVEPFEAIIRQSKWDANVSNFIVTHNKLYKKSLFENVLFPEGRLFEDESITHKLFMKSKKIISIQDSYYCYRIRSNSIMTSNFSIKKIEDSIYYINEKFSDIVLYGDGKYLQDFREKAYKSLIEYKTFLEINNLVNEDIYNYIVTKIELYDLGSGD